MLARSPTLLRPSQPTTTWPHRQRLRPPTAASGRTKRRKAHQTDVTKSRTTESRGRTLAKSPLAVAQAKLAINRGGEMGSEDGYAFEAETFATCFSGPDQKEGMHAFVEKRKPSFRT
jgi:enoyl-CoA hydratase/carnithine racemase